MTYRTFLMMLTIVLMSSLVQAQEDFQIDCTAPIQIWQVQGSGDEAICLLERVLINHAVVTGVGASGFFIQTPVEYSDNDDTTSDGIFVFTNIPGAAFGVQVGDLVTVEGRVEEFYNLSQLSVSGRRRVEVLSSGAPLPTPIDLSTVDTEWDVLSDVHPLERYEGMLVQITDGLVVAPTNYFDEFGVTITGERAFREAGIERDLTPEFANMGLPEFDLNPELIEIDPPEMALPVEMVTVGSRVTVTGGLSYSYQDYQIWPTQLEITPAGYVAQPIPPREAGEIIIATQNMLNLFDLVDDPRREDAPQEDYVPDNTAIYQTRLAKMSEQVRINLGAPDILAIQEIENARVLTDLALQIHADDPSLRYGTCIYEGNDTRGIDNAYLYRTDTVNLNACYQMPDSMNARYEGIQLYGRPPLILDVDVLSSSGAFPLLLINIHIKSLSGADTRTVQRQRFEEAAGIAQYIQSIQDARPDVYLAVLGDFNGFEVTDGLVDVVGIISGTATSDGALVAPENDTLEPNLINQVMRVPQAERYSYIFNSTSQVLDHILTTSALDACVTRAAFSRGNADALYEWEEVDNGALRSSDHDGLAIYINPACQ